MQYIISNKKKYIHQGGIQLLSLRFPVLRGCRGCDRMVVGFTLDLQLPVQLVHITTNVCGFEYRSWRGVLDITICHNV